MNVRHRIMPGLLVAALAGSALAVALAAPAHAAERQYLPTDLGSLGGDTTAVALNEAGVVVGTSAGHAFRWQNGQLTDLGTLGGDTSRAAAVNENGVVAGTSTDADGRDHAVIWRGARIVDLGLGTAVGINDRGQVIGDRTTATGTRRVLWHQGIATDLGPVPEGTYTYGINNRGDIIGTFPEPPGQPCGCTASAGIVHNRRLTTFGSFAPSTFNPASRPLGYNNKGDVVGLAAIEDGLSRPFRWHNGTLTQLPILGGYEGAAFGVNDSGLAVGRAQTDRQFPFAVPVTWTGSVVNDLTDQGLDWADSPAGVNNHGQIITNRDGRAYLYR
jgi:probable HAF family extracellular repeat protein